MSEGTYPFSKSSAKTKVFMVEPGWRAAVAKLNEAYVPADAAYAALVEAAKPIDAARAKFLATWNQHRADVALAREYGIQGVPFFVIDGKYGVSGAQDATTFANVLTQVQTERSMERSE